MLVASCYSYASSKWRAQNDTANHGIGRGVYYTAAADGKAVYAILMAWPDGPTVTLTQPKPQKAATVTMLGVPSVDITWSPGSGDHGMSITMPVLRPNQLPSFTGPWVLKLTNVE